MEGALLLAEWTQARMDRGMDARPGVTAVPQGAPDQAA